MAHERITLNTEDLARLMRGGIIEANTARARIEIRLEDIGIEKMIFVVCQAASDILEQHLVTIDLETIGSSFQFSVMDVGHLASELSKIVSQNVPPLLPETQVMTAKQVAEVVNWMNKMQFKIQRALAELGTMRQRADDEQVAP